METNARKMTHNPSNFRINARDTLLFKVTVPSKSLVAAQLDDDDIQTRTFTVETFDNAFCKVNQNNHIELNKNCNSLDEQGCNSTNCCVYVNHDNKKECMGGNEQGPHFNGTEKK